MRIFEITNPEEQLGLLRLIIDNTWSAIASQAEQHRQSTTPRSATSKPKLTANVIRKTKLMSLSPAKLEKMKPSSALSNSGNKPAATLQSFPLSNPQFYQQFLKPGFKSMQAAR